MRHCGSYDAIILGEIPAEQFDKTDADRIRNFVTRGGGLIVIDGRYDRMPTIAKDLLARADPCPLLRPCDRWQ